MCSSLSKDDHTEWVPLIDTYLERNRGSRPFFLGDGSRQVRVPQLAEFWKGIIVCQRKLDQRVVYTPIGIGHVKPCNGKGALQFLGRFDHCCQLGLMLSHPRNSGEEGFLKIGVMFLAIVGSLRGRDFWFQQNSCSCGVWLIGRQGRKLFSVR